VKRQSGSASDTDALQNHRTLPSLERNFQLQIFFKERPKVSLFSASILFLAASESGLLAAATVRRLSAEITLIRKNFFIRGKPDNLTTKSDYDFL